MIKILLNIHEQELENRIGGDYSFYRSLLDVAASDLRFSTVNRHLLRSLWLSSSIVYGTLYHNYRWVRRLLPARLRQAAYVRCLSNPILLGRNSRCVQIVYSHISFPMLHSDFHIPIIWSHQGLFPQYYDYLGENRFQDAIMMFKEFGRKADLIHLWTEKGAENVVKYCGLPKDKIRVIPPLVQTNPVKDLESKCKIPIKVLFVGLDATRKGLPQAIEVFSRLSRKYRHVDFVVVTQNPYYGYSTNSVKTMRLYGPVSKSKMNQLLEAAAILFIPTRADTYNLLLVEGMAKGCAIVTSAIDPLQEVVRDGQEGFLVSPFDIDCLVEKLSALIEDTDLRLQMGAAGIKKYLAEHSEERFLARFGAMVEELVK